MLRNPIDGQAYGFRLIGDGDQTFITHYGGNVGYTAGMTINLVTGHGAVFMTNPEAGTKLGLDFLQSLVGRYRFAEQGWQVSVIVEAGSLTLDFSNGDRYALVAISNGPREFIHPATAVRAGFDSTETETRLRLYGAVGIREVAPE